jgi:predicted nucleic acid-binding protein
MTPTVLIDTNVVLDVILDREPFVADSSDVWIACDAGRFAGYVSAISLPTIYYVVRQARGRDVALRAVDQCLAAFEIAPVYRESLEAARGFDGADFEDDVQIACAVTSLLEFIVTRNPADFVKSPIPVVSPAEFMSRLPSGGQDAGDQS